MAIEAIVLVAAPAVADAAAVDSIRTVALTGQQAPGAPSGATFSASYILAGLNDAGQSAFIAQLAGTEVSDANSVGIWSDGSGSLALVARQGDHAPGTPSGVTFDAPGGFPFDVFGTPILNNLGQTAFSARLAGTGMLFDLGLWSEGSGSVALVARLGSQAPDTPSGVSYSFIDDFSLALNDAGQTAFGALLSGSGVDITNASGIWSERSGRLALVARGGRHAPGTPDDVNFESFALYRPLALNDAGQTAFFAYLAGSGVDDTNRVGVWSEGSGNLALVARSGTPAPGTASGVNFRLFAPPSLSNAGQAAFLAALDGVGVNSANERGIWVERSGGLTLIAREGSPAPGTPRAVRFSFFDDFYFHMNDAARIALRAYLTGSGVDLTNHEGIWSEGFGSLSLVARTGSHAPGTPSGVYFGDPSTSSFGTPLLNDAGQVAFIGYLNGTGVDSTNNFGIWATDRTGTLRLIVRTGDSLEVAPGDIRTIDFLESAAKGGFNNLGQLAFTAHFTDGSAGILVSNLVAIPEPCSDALLLAASILLLFAGRPGGRLRLPGPR